MNFETQNTSEIVIPSEEMEIDIETEEFITEDIKTEEVITEQVNTDVKTIPSSVLAITFTDKERDNYKRQQDKCVFKTPEEEYSWAQTQFKKCSKCFTDKKLTEYNGNTSGTDAFDRSGYRLRRPECSECTKNANKGKEIARKLAKETGIAYKAPEGTVCGICNKPPSRGNGLVFDHCHEKNIFRGYACNACNRSVGVLGDNVDGLLRALNYLLKDENCKIVQNEDGTLSRVI